MRQHADRPPAILVVDDCETIQQLVKAFLESAGYAVMVAGDGDAALEFLAPDRPAISLILTDVDMPRMNGMDLAERVLELDAELPVVFMSGTSCGADRGYGCVAKPFQASELLARVGSALESGPRWLRETENLWPYGQY